jgi:hypothetical protein
MQWRDREGKEAAEIAAIDVPRRRFDLAVCGWSL